MSKKAIILVLFSIFSLSHAREINIKLKYKTKLNFRGVHQLVIKDVNATLDGLKLDSNLLPAISNELSHLLHFTAEKRTTCYGGSYEHIIIIDKKEKVQNGCIENAHFGRVKQAFESIRITQGKLERSK